MKALLIAASVATAHVAVANTLTVPGTADPLLAGGGTDIYGGDPANTDSTPNQSPVFAGSVTAGTTINWSATGTTGNDPSQVGTSPNGDGTPVGFTATIIGGSLAYSPAGFTAPINSLIGVFTGSGSADVFYMGTSGSVTVPAGATGLFLGSMDEYQWNNNVGSFNVNVSGVPDGGMTISLLGGALVGVGALRRKLSL